MIDFKGALSQDFDPKMVLLTGRNINIYWINNIYFYDSFMFYVQAFLQSLSSLLRGN
jgi:hypothetical protein